MSSQALHARLKDPRKTACQHTTESPSFLSSALSLKLKSAILSGDLVLREVLDTGAIARTLHLLLELG